MDIIQMPRQYGKSTAIVRLMAPNDDSVCVVVNQQMVIHMAEELYMYLSEHFPDKIVGKTPRAFERRFFTYHSWGTTARMRRPSKVYVDDLDMVVSQFLGVGVDVATYSPPQRWERP